MSLQSPIPGNKISDHLRRWREHRDVVALLKAGYCVLRQGRATELMYGLYCAGVSRPSIVRGTANDDLAAAVRCLRGDLRVSIRHVGRAAIIDAYRDRFAVDNLPDDFYGCRYQTIALISGRLVLGEYAPNSGRIAIVSKEHCAVYNPYEQIRGVRHVHLIAPTGIADEMFVTTGDALKVLDRVTIADGTPRIIQRHRKRNGGFTATAFVNGTHYFGTDFSSRPNYLETLDGRKYFFPGDAYSRWVLSLTPLANRYIVSVHRDMFGEEEKTVTVFDAAAEEFVMCKRWQDG